MELNRRERRQQLDQIQNIKVTAEGPGMRRREDLSQTHAKGVEEVGASAKYFNVND